MSDELRCWDDDPGCNCANASPRSADVTREPTGGQGLREALIAMLRSLHRDHSGHVNSADEADAVLALPDLAALIADAERVRNVRELHARDSTVPYACDYCGQAWPCDVIHALDTALDGEPQP